MEINEKELIEELKKKFEEFQKSLEDALGSPMFWDEYLEYIKNWLGPDMPEKVKKVRKIIEENNLYGMTGIEYQCSEWFERIYKEVGIQLSQRAWGRLMASLMNTREGKRKYIYIDFAW